MPSSCIRQQVINGYQHIMACPLNRAWVLLVIVHFIVQVALQGVTLRENKEAMHVTELCLSLIQVPAGLPLLQGDDLSMCSGIPGRKNVTCVLIASTSGLPLTSSSNASYLSDYDLDDIHSIRIAGSERFITGRCAISLRWIHDIFRDNAAEDIATICFQFWLLIISLLAVLQDSIPHLAVCLASHLLGVDWAGFRIKSTITLRQDYNRFVVDSACEGQDVLGNWWDQRLAHAAPLFGTNVIMFIMLGALSVVLFRVFAKVNFSHVGVSAQITRMYKIALSFSAFRQLATFFIVLGAGMWIDRVSFGTIATHTRNLQVYQASFILLAVITPPWVISGWWAIFRESKRTFILFGVLDLFFIIGWPTMFASTIYRYVFGTWSFFACISVTSYVLVIATTVTAIICRLHFGRGLRHFLMVEADLTSSGFPGSFFTNDPTHVRSGSPTSFTFSFLDAEKARGGSMEDSEEGLMHIRPYTLESSKYSIRTLSFEPSTNGSKTSGMTALRPLSATSTKIIRTLNKGGEEPLPTEKVDSGPRPVSYVFRTDRNSPENTIFTRDKKRSWIRSPPEAHLQAPHKETRSRKDTPSTATQATDRSTNSHSQAVITVAMKNRVMNATARTMLTDTMPSRRTSSPVDAVIPHEDRPSIDLETGISIKTVSRRRPTFVGTVSGPSRIRYPPQLDNYGRI